MDRLRCLEIFGEVARGGSFTAAAGHFGISRAAVSKHVAWLERSLGAPLLARTTKHVGLTDAGRRVLDNAALLLERYEAIENDARDAMAAPRGVVRVGTPPSFGARHLVPLIAEFVALHPDIQIALELDDGRASLVADRLDLSVRIAPALDDAGFVAQTLVEAPQVLVASPAYLERRGTPAAPEELARHDCLVHTLKAPTARWHFTGPAGDAWVRVRGPLRSNLGEALRGAALHGLGLSIHPWYMVSEDIARGRLRIVLPAHAPTRLDIHVIYSARRNQPQRVRVFLDFLRRWARTPPDWSVPRPGADADRGAGAAAAPSPAAAPRGPAPGIPASPSAAPLPAGPAAGSR